MAASAKLLVVAGAVLAMGLLSGCKDVLTVEVKGKGMVNVLGVEEPQVCTEPVCTYELPSGSQLTFKASGVAGTQFQAWTGDCIGENAECTLELSGPKSVRASFVKRVKISVVVTGDGQVLSADGNIECPGKACEAHYVEGTEVVFRRKAGTDVFEGYTGACTGKDCSLIAKSDVTLTASFTRPPGEALGGALVGEGDLKEARVGIAVDEKGWAVATAEPKRVLLTRFNDARAEQWRTPLATGKVTYPPAVGFYGDDVVVVASSDSSTMVSRVAPDGKTERYSKLHTGCPGFSRVALAGDGVFAAGAFDGTGSTCGDKELISSGGHDVLVARFAVEDGGLTWVSQLGSKKDDHLAGFGVTPVEDAWLAYNAGERGGRLVRTNPAGKAYPEMEWGKPDDTELLDLRVWKKNQLKIYGHVFSAVDLGGKTLGVAAKDGAGRLVWVDTDDEGRHQASDLVARSRCGEQWMCAFDDAGGLLRITLPEGPPPPPKAKKAKKPKKKKKKGKKGEEEPEEEEAPSANWPAGTFEIDIHRLAPDGAERWASRLPGTGYFQPGVIVAGPRATWLIVGVLHGEVKLGRDKKLTADAPSAVWIQVKD